MRGGFFALVGCALWGCDVPPGAAGAPDLAVDASMVAADGPQLVLDAAAADLTAPLDGSAPASDGLPAMPADLASADGGTTAHCSDGVKGPGETDVDCGGECPPCATGRGCLLGADCITNACWSRMYITSPRCVPPTCANRMTDPDETDKDCGGPICRASAQCVQGQKCAIDADCLYGSCYQGICQPVPTCDDGLQNQDETNIDCGGATCAACAVSFAPVVLYPVGAFSRAVVTGDFDHDGHLDLAIAAANDNQVQIFLGDGTGAFVSQQVLAVAGSPWWIAAGDFDGDGRLDLVTANTMSDDLSLLIGQGDGTFVEASRPSLGGSRPDYVVTADFNGDGKLDVAVAYWHYGTSVGSNDVRIGLGDGAGSLALASEFTTAEAPLALATGDLDGDGRLDLVVGNFDVSQTENLTVLRGGGDGTFQRIAGYGAAASMFALGLGDLDGDGTLDLAASPVVFLFTFPGRGDGTFGTGYGSDFDVLGWGGLGLADFDGDGRLDVALTVQGRPPLGPWGPDLLGVFVAPGTGAFATPALVFPDGTRPIGLTIGDFDEDGQPDVAVANSGDSSSGAGSTLAVFLNRSH